MMLRQVLEPAEERAGTVSATGPLDMSTGVPLPQVTEEHCTWGPGIMGQLSARQQDQVSSLGLSLHLLARLESAASDCVTCTL